MRFNKHYDLEGAHAFLGASKYHWINYSPERLKETYLRHRASQYGTAVHELAKNHIRLGIKMGRSRNALNLYVNDAIGYKMEVEQTLFYSYNCFGTADAISFRNDVLRIHDLKTGSSRVSMNQLLVYAAIFCLEYDFRPGAIQIELRIYQDGEDILVYEPEPDEIFHIMDKIVTFDKQIEALKEAGSV